MQDSPDALNVQELHDRAYQLECACLSARDANQFTDIADNEHLRRVASPYLRAYRSYWLGSPSDTAAHLAKLTGPRFAGNMPARYFARRGQCLLAKLHWRQGNLPAAFTAAREAQSLTKDSQLPALKAEALCLLSQVHAGTCEWTSAQDAALDALATVRRGPAAPLAEAAAWFALGYAQFNSGNFNSAHICLDSALPMYANEQMPDEFGQIETQLLWAHLCYSGGDHERHNRLLADAEQLCRRNRYVRGLGTICRYRGKLELDRAKQDHSRWEKARDLFELSLREFTKLRDPAAIARSHLSLARAFAVGGESKTALRHYAAAKSGFLEGGDRVRAAMASVTEGLVAARAGKRPTRKVRDGFDNALRDFREHKDRRHLSAALYDVAMQYRQWGEDSKGTPESAEFFASAAEYFREAVATASDMHAAHLVRRYQAETRLTETEAKWSEALLASARDREELHLLVDSYLHDLTGEATHLVAPFNDLHRAAADEQTRQRTSKLRAATQFLCSRLDGIWNLMLFREFKLDKEPLELLSLVEDAFAIVWPEPDPGIACRKEIPARLCVFADRKELLAVFVNLLGNAGHFIEKMQSAGEMKRGAVAVRAKEEDESVRVTICDNGPGIPEELRASVNDPQAMSRHYANLAKTETSLRGYNISLAFCSLVIEKHGGKMWVDSKKTRRQGEDTNRPSDHGTVIHFTLPKDAHDKAKSPDQTKRRR